MTPQSILGSALIALLTVAGSAHATIIGNATIARNQDSDGDATILNILNTPVPSLGQIDAFRTYNMDLSGTGNAFSFDALILRPTGNASEYTVIFDSGPLTTGFSPNGAVVSFPVGPISVQAGDLIASYGNGIPFDFGGENPQAVYYPVPSVPSGTFTAAPLGQVRTYSFAADFQPAPEPSAFVIAGLGAAMLLLGRGRFGR